MIYALYLLLPLAAGALAFLTGVTIELVLAVAVAWLLAAAGLLVRRFVLVVASAVILILAFLAQVFSSSPPQLAPAAVAFGVGVFGMLELGHDAISVKHGKLTLRAYALRARFIALVAAVDLVAVFVLATVAYNLAVRYPGLPLAVLLMPAVAVVIAGVAVMIVARLRRIEADRPR